MLRALVIFVTVLLPILAAAQLWTEHTVEFNYDYASDVYATDVDGDGDIDVLGAAAGSTDEITWWENVDGIGLSLVEHTVDDDFNGAISVYAADVDGDGDTDVIGAAETANDISWWENVDGVGLNWVEHPIDANFQGAHDVYATDVDGDGDTDILGAAATDDEITWWENTDGSGLNWDEHLVVNGFGFAYSVYATDMDSDGDIDVLGAANNSDDIKWWENVDGSGLNWIEHEVDGSFNGPECVYATDVDGDGDTDVLGAAQYGEDISWWENVDGGGLIWTQHIVDADFNGALSVYATDIDNDGDADVLGAAYVADDITWWENVDGDGLNWAEHTLDGDFNAAWSISAADVDGDGNMDVLGVARGDGITWWSQPGPPVQLTPGMDPVIVPLGDSFDYSVDIELGIAEPRFGAIWSEAILPDGNTYGPIYEINYYFGTYTQHHVEGLIQQIPLFAPLGDYEFVLNIGLNSNTPAFSDSFPFTVVEGGARFSNTNDQGWTSHGHERLIASGDTEIDNDTPLLAEYALQPVYPNPFNPTATISVSLPETAPLDIVVFDVMGRQIATIANDHQGAGTHTFTFDGSNLASGLYFVRATVAGQMDQVQKVMLVR
jgi:Secretion system C-terminal sorting domain/FG-GAP-like repeat